MDDPLKDGDKHGKNPSDATTSNNASESKQEDSTDSPTFCKAIPMTTSNVSCGVEYLVSDAVRKGGLTVIYGTKGDGKSILSYQIAQSIAKGTPCLAFPNDTVHKPQPVIYLNAELHQSDFVDRGYSQIEHLHVYNGFNYSSAEDLHTDLENLLRDIYEDCTIVLDCISNHIFGLNLSSPSSMKEFNRVIAEIETTAKKRGIIVSFIVVTHADKSNHKNLKGCQDYYQNATSIIQVHRTSCQTERIIEVTRNRSGSEGSWNVKKVNPSSTVGLHFKCCKTSTHSTLQNQTNQSTETMSAPATVTTSTPKNTFATTPEEELEQTLVEMDYTLPQAIDMEAQASQDKEMRERLYLIVKQLRENHSFSWDLIEQSIRVSKQRYNNWKKEFEK